MRTARNRSPIATATAAAAAAAIVLMVALPNASHSETVISRASQATAPPPRPTVTLALAVSSPLFNQFTAVSPSILLALSRQAQGQRWGWVATLRARRASIPGATRIRSGATIALRLQPWRSRGLNLQAGIGADAYYERLAFALGERDIRGADAGAALLLELGIGWQLSEHFLVQVLAHPQLASTSSAGYAADLTIAVGVTL